MEENTMQFTTIVSDFDGTILKNGAMEMDPAFLDTLEKVLDKGIRFIAASGRQYANLRYLMGRLSDRVSYICENGALAFSGGEMIHECIVDPELLQAVIEDMMKEPDVMIVPCSVTTDYVLEKDTWMQNYLGNVMKSHITIVKDFSSFPEEIIKLSIFWENGVNKERQKYYHEKYGEKLQFMDSGSRWVDFTHLQANKGVALRKMAEKEGFLLEETVAFGDNENDMGMLQEAGFAYVMEQAMEHVKAVGDKECSDVAEVLRELFFIA